jgi:uncharacterized protein YegL
MNPDFVENPDNRCACVLLLDTSGSMDGAPIAALNAGLQVFQQDLQSDPLAMRRVEIAIVTFGNGGVQSSNHFTSASQFTAPALTAGGGTPLGEATLVGLDLLASRKQEYRQNGVPYYRPWVILITDGAPDGSDPWEQAAKRARAESDAKGLTFFGLGVEGANMAVLSKFTDRVRKLDGLKFKEFFEWLSASQKAVAHSKTDDQVALPRTTFDSPV